MTVGRLRDRWGGLGRGARAGVVLVGVTAVLLGGVAVVLGAGGSPGSPGSAVEARPSPVVPGGDTAAPAVGFAAPADAARSAAPEQREADVAVPLPGVPVGAVDRALVRTAQVSVEVADPAAAGRQVRTAVAAAGGFVTEEQSGTRGAVLVLRVPVAALDRLLDDVGTVGTVLERSGQVVDATEQVVDLDARVASQQASVARVRTLLAQAQSIGDVVAIESELSRREAELDSLTGRLAALRDQAALSTLTVDLRPAPDAAAGDEDDRALGFADGLGAGWDGLKAFALAVAVVIGFLMPLLPVLAMVVGVGWLVRRAARGRQRTDVAAAPPA